MSCSNRLSDASILYKNKIVNKQNIIVKSASDLLINIKLKDN